MSLGGSTHAIFRAARDSGRSATRQFQVAVRREQVPRYLPLAVGNSWTYGWAYLPPEWTAKEVYRVIANEGDMWYLEHYGYSYNR